MTDAFDFHPPASGTTLADFAVRIDFDEGSRTWRTFIPALDLYRTGIATQEEAIQGVRSALAEGMVEAQTAAVRRAWERRAERWLWGTVAAAGFLLGANAIALVTLSGWPGWVVETVCAALGATACVVCSAGQRRAFSRPPFPEPHELGPDGWPIADQKK
jgi:peptidoglycan/LPS O-acetylase OafA/YrhL